ncbi:MAG: hypothetical protein KatS3mg057_3209 [Herpetosiphonaceae bacterium]|nr:MAG: hypothetical protein KatS3mg057_3209 [Herpetosiphonaceae bacterium]
MAGRKTMTLLLIAAALLLAGCDTAGAPATPTSGQAASTPTSESYPYPVVPGNDGPVTYPEPNSQPPVLTPYPEPTP